MPWTPDSYYYFVLQGACKHHKIPTKILYKDLTDKQKKIILHGSDERLSLSTPQMNKPWNAKYPGIIPYLNRVYHDPETSDALHEKIDPFVVSSTCKTCQGYRVGEAARSVIIDGKHIGHVADMSVEKTIDFFEHIQLSGEEAKIAGNVLKNIRDRLKFLKGVGL